MERIHHHEMDSEEDTIDLQKEEEDHKEDDEPPLKRKKELDEREIDSEKEKDLKHSTHFSFITNDQSKVSPLRSGSFSTDEKYSTFRKSSLEYVLTYGVNALKGRRKSMEDAYKAVNFINSKSVPECERNHAFFGVYDGHGGPQVAEYARDSLYNFLKESNFSNDPQLALKEAFQRTEETLFQMYKEKKINGGVGTTATTALICESVLYIAHVGDSTAVLCRNEKATEITNAHNVHNKQELERLEKLNAVIVRNRLGHPHWNPNMISIEVTRALGDFYFKDKECTNNKESGLIAEPEIHKIPLTRNDDFLIIASDGFRNVVSAEEAVNFTLQRPSCNPDIICRELTQLAFNRKVKDNITVLLIKFH